MKRLLLLSPCLVILAGCEERVALFAARTNDLLQEYQKRIANQMTESSAYYQKYAVQQSFETKRIGVDSLEAERNERAGELEAEYRMGRKQPASYRTHLREYADLQYKRNLEWLSSDTDSVAAYLQKLTKLEQDKATVDAFSKILLNLAKPRSLKDEIEEAKKFVSDAKAEFDKLVCDEINGNVEKLSKPGENESDAAKAEREAKLADAKKLQSDKKCKAAS